MKRRRTERKTSAVSGESFLRAMRLFSRGKSPMEVAEKVGIREKDARRIYCCFLQNKSLAKKILAERKDVAKELISESNQLTVERNLKIINRKIHRGFIYPYNSEIDRRLDLLESFFRVQDLKATLIFLIPSDGGPPFTLYLDSQSPFSRPSKS